MVTMKVQADFWRQKRSWAAVKKTHVSEKPIALSSCGKILC
jgi:hypothetical protein